MSKTHKDQRRRGHGAKPERRISVRGVRRDPPDYRKLARALIAIAQAEAEAETGQRTNAADSMARGMPPPEAA